MMQKKMTMKFMAGLLAAVLMITSVIMPAMAAADRNTGEGKAEDAGHLPLFMEVADQLDPGEDVKAEDIEITAGDEFDPGTDFTGITYDEEKVKVSLSRASDENGNAFSTGKPGTYEAVYHAEPAGSGLAYTFSRKIIVKEKDSGSGGADKKGGSKGSPSEDGRAEDDGEESDEESGSEKDRVEEDEGADGSTAGTGKTDSKETDPETDDSTADTGKEDSAAESATGQTPDGSTQAPDESTGQEEGTTQAADESTQAAEGTGQVADEEPFTAAKADELSYHLLFIAAHAKKEYVDTDIIDVSAMYHPVTVARGLATYNVKKQKEFAVTANFLAGLTYELPVYDIDPDSQYYVAVPNVNLYNKDLAAYDVTVTYNNDNGEQVEGYLFEDDILYIPKKVIDEPDNKAALIGNSPVAVQLNYAFGGLDPDKEGNADFGKSLPVQVLDSVKGKPENRKVKAANIFDTQTVVPDVVPSGHGYKAKDFTVFLNGMMMPAAGDAWDLVGGDIVINSPAAIISNVNILFTGKTKADRLLDAIKTAFSPEVHAGTKVSMKDMKYYKNKKGKYVTVDLGTNMFVGWRGYYSADLRYVGTDKNDNKNYTFLKENSDYAELKNSAYYLYGGYGSGRDASKNDAAWAIESYCLGANKAVGVSDTLTASKKIHENDDTSGETKTIYEWMLKYRNYLEKTIGGWGGGHTNYAEGSNASGTGEGDVKGVTESGDDHISNGAGGSTDFAFKVPSTIKGSDENFVPEGHEGHGQANGNVKFSTEQLPDNAYFSAGCTHLDEVAGSDSDGAKTVYVACLGLNVDDNGQRYAVLAFTSADKGSTGQEACAIYKFKAASPVALKKTSASPAISDGNACYADLSGGKYGLYESSADAEADKDRAATFTTKADGSTNVETVAAGTYYVKELTAPKNYALNPSVVKITVSGSNDTQTFTMTDPPKNNPLDLVLIKIDKETGKAEPQGAGTLAGAEFTVKYFDNENGDASGSPKKTWIFKTDDKGEVHLRDAYKVSGDPLYKGSGGNDTLPVGTCSVQETKAPAGYLIVDGSPAVQVIKASGNGETFAAFVTKNVPNQIIRGGVQIKKEDTKTGGTSQGDADFSGITFAITNESSRSVRVDGKDYAKGEVVKSIVTDTAGIAKTGNKDLPYGDYSIKEVKTNASYLLTDGKAKTFQIREDGKTVELSEPVKDEVVRGDVEIEKLDLETGIRVPQGSATLVGTTFAITNKSKNPVEVDGKVFQPGQVVKTIRIEKEETTAKTTGKALPYGTYSIKETAIGTGYLLTDTKERTFQIREDGKTVSIAKDGDIKDPFRNQVKRGGVLIHKEDTITGSTPQGDADFAGISFEITNESLRSVRVGGKDYAKGAVVKTIVTDETGTAKTGNKDLPYGEYTIKEVKTNVSYLLTDGKAKSFQIREDGKIVEIVEAFKDEVVRGDVEIEKLDRETDVRVPLGSATHVGTTFAITNKSKNPVVVDGKLYKVGEVCKTIKIEKEKETAKTTGRTLPYGTYTIKEVAVGTGYLLTDTKERTFQIRVDGKTVRVAKDGDVKEPFRNQVKRGDFNFIKVFEDADSDRNMNALAHIPFEVISKTTGEKHIIVTDENGQFDSDNDWFAHSKDTNANDPAVSAEGKVDESKLTSEAGVWFDTDREGNKAKKVDDTLGALPYDSYVMNELPCKANDGAKLIKNREFTIRVDKRNVSLGTIDDPSGKEIGTVAVDGLTKDHFGSNASESIIDTVTFKGLTKGQKYTMKGTLIDKAAEEPVTAGGKKVTAKETFTAEDTSGTVKVTFTFPKDALKGKEVVAFETCESGGKVIAVHEDPEDADQTVVYPDIETEAKDGQTESHYGLNDSTTVKDIVRYVNLVPGKEYTMTGKLMDKGSGREILSDGKAITAEKKFTPDKKDGEIELVFEVPAGLLTGKSVVAFETCYQEKTEVAFHTDLNDEDQTVHYPDIGTEAVDGLSKTHYGHSKSTKVIDIVSYFNLEPGKEYTMKGTLMDKATGKEFQSGDKKITSEVTFTPAEKDGKVEMAFEVPEGFLAGKTVVAFETCYLEDKEIAVHADIKDEEQTVYYPDIRTEAKDEVTGAHYGSGTATKLVDTVTYTGLEPGKEYTMKGTLMDKATGKALQDGDGAAFTAEKKFTPEKTEGTVEIVFEFPAGLLAGKTVVAFETCNREDKEVAAHADIEDENQTVAYPDIRTEAKDALTRTHYGAGSSTKLTDTVTYSNLEPGKEYTMKGILMDKATGKAVLHDGKEITAEKKFTPEKKDGTVEIVFEFPAGLLADKTVVAFETCYREDNEIAVHANIEDENQTVYYPQIGTVLTDDKTKDHIAAADKTLTLTDTVEYKNLEPGREYTMTGRLMDRDTGKAVSVSGKEVTASQTFTPKEKDGSIKLTFTVAREGIEGTTLVAFEKALTTIGETEVTAAVHEDLKDEAQSVHLPKIATNAVDKGTKTHKGKVKKTVKIEDKVNYKNLIPGKKYTMNGTLMDEGTGKALKDAKGKTITAKKEFTPEKADGSVTLTFTVSGKIVEGKKVVAFESCRYQDTEVAVHADLSDKNQTVEYPKDKTPDKPSGGKPSGDNSQRTVTSSPKTGDDTNLGLWIGIFLASAAGAVITVILLIRKRRKKKTW